MLDVVVFILFSRAITKYIFSPALMPTRYIFTALVSIGLAIIYGLKVLYNLSFQLLHLFINNSIAIFFPGQ